MLAFDALDMYDIDVYRVVRIADHLNNLYRVDTVDGQRFALRISNPTWRSELELRSEISWLLALDAETDIGAHVPIPNRSGDFITTVRRPGVPEPRRSVLFSWIPGVDLVRRLTARNVQEMGRLAATLHAHGSSFEPDRPFTDRKLDRLFPRGEQVVLDDPAFGHLFADGQREVFDRAREMAEAELARLYHGPARPIIVHGDLHHENVKVDAGKLRPVDFEDIVWAYPVQDIALTYFDFRYFAPEGAPGYEELTAWFEQGYRQVSVWPVKGAEQIDILHVARQFWVANWVLLNDAPIHHQPFIDRLTARFRTVLETVSPST